MQRLPQTLRIFSSALNAPNCAGTTTTRWKKWTRKPLGQTAKSKIFRVAKRPVLPPEEEVEIRRLYNNYRTAVKSIRAYLTDKYSISNLETSDPEQIRRLFEEDFERCAKINDEWNEQQRIAREKQTAERLAEQIEFAKQRIAEHEEQKRIRLEEIEELVRQEKEKSATYILDLDALDAAIEHALANPTDYNFAIDLDGNKIQGRETTPTSKEAVKQ